MLARAAGRAFTDADVDARLADVPAMSRPEYTTPGGRARLLREMVEEEVYYRAALDGRLDKDPDVARQLTSARRKILVQALLQHEQAKLAQVDEHEARAFYDAHKAEYRTETTLKVRLLGAKSRQIAERVREMAEQGQPFDVLCQKFSTDPFLVEARGLLPDPVRRGRAVPWLGNQKVFHDVVFGLKKGELSQVFETPKGFHVAKVEEIEEGRQRTFEEARADVEARILRERNAKGLAALTSELEKKYHAEIVETPGRTPEELFKAAQQSPDPADRIARWQELVDRYPEDPHVVEALFMIGFTKSEELHDAEGARVFFQRVVDEFPGSELAQSAQWMLTSPEGDTAPPFETAPGGSTAPGESGDE